MAYTRMPLVVPTALSFQDLNMRYFGQTTRSTGGEYDSELRESEDTGMVGHLCSHNAVEGDRNANVFSSPHGGPCPRSPESWAPPRTFRTHALPALHHEMPRRTSGTMMTSETSWSKEVALTASSWRSMASPTHDVMSTRIDEWLQVTRDHAVL